MTAEQIRDDVDAAKKHAMANFEKNHGAAAVNGLRALRKNNGKALAGICAALRAAP